jgi:phosphoglycerate dehydrogenase-like enzyme
VELRIAMGDEAAAAARDAEIIVCGTLPVSSLDDAPALRWISYWSAGLDGKIPAEFSHRDLKVTSANGVHGPNIAEHVLGFMLMFVRNLHLFVRAQVDGEWRRNFVSQSFGADELTGKTLGIIGYGRIGEALTHRARSFDMRVIATSRTAVPRPDALAIPDLLLPNEDMDTVLAEADFLCLSLPYTPATHHLIDARALAKMKPTAYLINIARGKVVDEAALVAALQDKTLAGAGLDVFEEEPLPADSPLWKMENVIITPHVAGLTPHYYDRAAVLFADNLERYLRGERLQNQFDPGRGY